MRTAQAGGETAERAAAARTLSVRERTRARREHTHPGREREGVVVDEGEARQRAQAERSYFKRRWRHFKGTSFCLLISKLSRFIQALQLFSVVHKGRDFKYLTCWQLLKGQPMMSDGMQAFCHGVASWI